MSEIQTLDISWATILKIFLVIFAFYLAYLVREALVLSLFALIISILFEPGIDFLEKRKVPRVLGVILLYGLAFSLLALLIYLPAAQFVSEVRQFVGLFPVYFDELAPPLRSLGVEAFESMEKFVESLGRVAEVISANLLTVLASIFGGISSAVFVISVAIFISLEKGGVERNLILFFPKKYETYVLSLWERTQKKVSAWFLSTLLRSLFVGLVGYLAFLVFKVRYALVLSIFAGVSNIIPVIGPIFATFLILAIVALDSIQKALFAVAAFVLIQQIENNIIGPILTKKFVGLSPALVLISLVVGGQLFGFLGALLGIPLAGVIFEFTTEFLEKRRSP